MNLCNSLNRSFSSTQPVSLPISLGICSGFAVRLNVCTIRDISQHFYPFDFFLLSFIVCWFFSFSHLYWHVVGLQRTATVAVVVSVCLSAPQQYDQRLPPTPSPPDRLAAGPLTRGGDLRKRNTSIRRSRSDRRANIEKARDLQKHELAINNFSKEETTTIV